VVVGVMFAVFTLLPIMAAFFASKQYVTHAYIVYLVRHSLVLHRGFCHDRIAAWCSGGVLGTVFSFRSRSVAQGVVCIVGSWVWGSPSLTVASCILR
jgi:hypothetical protein